MSEWEWSGILQWGMEGGRIDSLVTVRVRPQSGEYRLHEFGSEDEYDPEEYLGIDDDEWEAIGVVYTSLDTLDPLDDKDATVFEIEASPDLRFWRSREIERIEG